jgi:alanine racemase
MVEFREPQRKCTSWYMRSGSAEKRHLQTKRRQTSIEPSMHPATLTVSLNALKRNDATFKRLAPNSIRAAVVKADCYGLGIGGIIPALVEIGYTRFFVAYPDEGIAVRQLLNAHALPASDYTIYVLCDLHKNTLPAYVEFLLTPVLNALEQIALWNEQGVASLRPLLQLNTGMNRCGLEETEWATAAAKLSFPLAYIMTHLACADEPEHPLNIQQNQAFQRAFAHFPDCGKSLAASWGTLLGTAYHYDILRLGTGLYGAMPHPLVENIVTLTTKILEVRQIDKGEAVGYGATYRSDAVKRVATIALGYADGYPRELSNIGVMYIEETAVPIIGRVSMDVITLDVTHVPEHNVIVGGVVTVYGKNYTINDAATDANTIGYEILTRLGRRVNRRYE